MTVLVSDSFNRANNSTSLGNADTGQAWQTTPGSIYGISNNQAYPISDTSGQVSFAYVDSGASDGTITLTLAAISNYQNYLVFRIVDNKNYLFVRYQKGSGNLQLYKTVNNAQTQLGTKSIGTLAIGSTISVTVSGSSITVSTNGTQQITTTDNTFSTSTLHGFGDVMSADLTVRYDNFEVDSLTSSTTTYIGSGNTTGTSSLTSTETYASSSIGSTYTGSGTTNGISSLSDISKVIVSEIGSFLGASTIVTTEHNINSNISAINGQSTLTATESFISHTGTGYSVSGISQGSSTLSDTSGYIYKSTISSIGTSVISTYDNVIYVDFANSQGKSSLSSNDTLVSHTGTSYSANGSTQGSVSINSKDNEINYTSGTVNSISYLSSGSSGEQVYGLTDKGQFTSSSLTDRGQFVFNGETEKGYQVIYLNSPSVIIVYNEQSLITGESNLTSNETITSYIGTIYSVYGESKGQSNLRVEEHVIQEVISLINGNSDSISNNIGTFYAIGTSDGISSLLTKDKYLSILEIIGTINFNGKRELNIYLVGKKELIINFKGVV